MCQLVIPNVNHNYTGNWTVEVIGGGDGQGDKENRTTWIQMQTTMLAKVTGESKSLSVVSGQRFTTSCEAAFGVPKPVGYG